MSPVNVIEVVVNRIGFSAVFYCTCTTGTQRTALVILSPDHLGFSTVSKPLNHPEKSPTAESTAPTRNLEARLHHGR